MYCSKCGFKLPDGDLFCSQCGQKLILPAQANAAANAPPAARPSVSPLPPQSTPPTAQQDDDVIWILRAQRRLSVVKSEICFVIFKRRYLVLAHMDNDSMKAETARMQSEGKAQGMGFLKGGVAMMQKWASYGQRYASMPTAAILAEHPENAMIGYLDIQEVNFKGYSTTTHFDDSSDSVSEGRLEFSFARGKAIKLKHEQEGSPYVRQTLSDLLGSKLKYKN